MEILQTGHVTDTWCNNGNKNGVHSIIVYVGVTGVMRHADAVDEGL